MVNRDASGSGLSRRTFLTATGMAGAAVALASCARGDTPAAAQTGGKRDPLAGVSGSTLNFAACLPISGAFTIITKPWAAAMKYACDEVNEAGGLKVGGKTVKVSSPLIDEGYAAAPALASAQKFFSQGGRYLGGLVSEEAPVAVLGINEQADALVTSCINGLPAMMPNKLRFFEDALTYRTGALRAQFAYNELGLRRIATIELKNSWGASYQETFAKAFTELGGQIVARDYMEVTDTDFSSRISGWKSKNPDGLYVIIGDGPGTTIAAQATQLGFDSQPILTEGAWDPNSYVKTGASFIERCYYLAEYPYCHWNADIAALAKKLYDDEKLYTTNWFWQGYDSTRMVLAAMAAANSTDPRDVIEALPHAIADGQDKWLVKAKGGVATETKGVYLQTPVWMARFKPVTTDFLSEAPLEPVKGAAYQEQPGWMPESWKGYKVAAGDVTVPSIDDIKALAG